MYACICSAVTVDEVDRAIDAGARTIEAVGQCTTAGTTCGTCHDTIDERIEVRCGACPLAAFALA
jgi:bacterioferritin-associated ferredoxin